MPTIPYPLAVLLTRLAERCGPVRPAGDEYRCRCPAHDDGSPSLYVRLDHDRILVRCGAGCGTEAVTGQLDLDTADLFVRPDDPAVDWQGAASSTPTTGPGDPDPSVRTAGHAPAVYAAVLDALGLSDAHRAALTARGLAAPDLVRRGYKSADPDRIAGAVDRLLATYTPDELLGTPGFELRGQRPVLAIPPGLVVPVRDPAGGVVALKVRRDDAGGPKYLCVSTRTAPASARAHVPLGAAAPAETVRLTEGELKADVATALSGLPTVGVPGVTQWALAVPVLEALGAKAVRVAMDRDGKPGTLSATEKAIIGLAEAGFVVEYETWDPATGKGIDDLLAGGGTSAVLDGLTGLVRVRAESTGPKAPAVPDPPPAAFPVDVFPPALVTFVLEAATATATPPDFIGSAVLAVAGAAIGNSTVLELKAGAWAESACLYLGVVGNPASGKSPALDLALAPVRDRQDGDLAAYEAAGEAHRQAAEAQEAAAAANRGLPPTQRAALPPVPPPPGPPRRCLIGDTTVEGMIPVLRRNPRGVLKVADEGSGLRAEQNQYKGGRGTDRQFYLSCWSHTAVTVDRRNLDGVPLSLRRPFLALLFGIQPDMLPELGDHRGRGDGDLDRKLFTFPDPLPPADWSDDGVSPAAAAAWAAALERLFAVPMPEGPGGVPLPTRVRFTPAGKAVWEAWYNAHAAELRDPTLSVALVGPWAKFRSHAARLALILHLLWADGGPGDGVGAESVARAGRLVAYFQDHTRRVYARLRKTPEDGRLHAALEWVRRRGGRCTARDVLSASLVGDSAAAKKLLHEFEARGYGRIETHPADNRKRVEWFVYDPAWNGDSVG
ncbi:MAG TPA: DUF3987 domain-containing protein [Urbifossiella sp.]|nr:DUF3987 domain-containing protein [Urbifossiella sp.]